MKYLKQVFIIFFISFLGELCNLCVPLPIPAGVYGLLLMLVALCAGIVKLPDVEDAGRFLIEMMPLMFIPGSAGVIEHYKEVMRVLWPFVIAVLLSTVVVMAVTGLVTQHVIRRKSGRWTE
ncbi:CidA/LrgA family protein [Cloacibacillus sp. An23]|uniref:CidA/LrgA family protein n=1 Tax=Cloacibacillus sp. An23 TaxID=1965591 RepID=UPI000B3ABF59|nr:CidA/LrgA family protein [Cloacibacillus sp. An23]OUO93962.1 murein hydrolase regulator LrgA [Cloacibacillus sp. An23]